MFMKIRIHQPLHFSSVLGILTNNKWKKLQSSNTMYADISYGYYFWGSFWRGKMGSEDKIFHKSWL